MNIGVEVGVIPAICRRGHMVRKRVPQGRLTHEKEFQSFLRNSNYLLLYPAINRRAIVGASLRDD